MAAIRQEFADCKAYGGTTVLVVPAVVNRKVGYRDAYKRSQENIRKLIPDADQHGVKIAIEEVWNKFLLSPLEFARYIDEFESPWVGAYFDVGNVVEYRLSRRNGSASWASESSRCTSRNTPRESGSITGWAKAEKSTGPPSAGPCTMSATRAGSPRRSPTGTSRR